MEKANDNPAIEIDIEQIAEGCLTTPMLIVVFAIILILAKLAQL